MSYSNFSLCIFLIGWPQFALAQPSDHALCTLLARPSGYDGKEVSFTGEYLYDNSRAYLAMPCEKIEIDGVIIPRMVELILPEERSPTLPGVRSRLSEQIESAMGDRCDFRLTLQATGTWRAISGIRDRFCISGESFTPIASLLLSEVDAITVEPGPAQMDAFLELDRSYCSSEARGTADECLRTSSLDHLVALGCAVQLQELLDDKGQPRAIADRSIAKEAARRGYQDVLSMLVSKGLSLDSGDERWSTLCFAAAHPMNDTVLRFLFEHEGTGVTSGCSALAVAARHGGAVNVRTLLDLGLDPSRRDRFVGTPLQAACSSGSREIWRLLRAAGADPLDTNSQWFSYYRHPGVECLRWLLEDGADPNNVDESRRSALSYYAESGEASAVKVLIDAGGDPDLVDDSGKTPRHYAVESGCGDVIAAMEGGASSRER